MASFLFTCRICQRRLRLTEEPRDFDNICEECSGRGAKETQGAGVQEAVVESPAKPRTGRRNAARGSRK